MYGNHFSGMFRTVQRVFLGLATVCLVLAVLLVMALVQDDDARAAAEAEAYARGWQQGYDDGVRQRAASVADAYRQGQRDAAIGLQMAEGGAP